jgi:hypothetical protein
MRKGRSRMLTDVLAFTEKKEAERKEETKLEGGRKESVMIMVTRIQRRPSPHASASYESITAGKRSGDEKKVAIRTFSDDTQCPLCCQIYCGKRGSSDVATKTGHSNSIKMPSTLFSFLLSLLPFPALRTFFRPSSSLASSLYPVHPTAFCV